jgi:predicted alpha/beta-hydrolase family hydrolase
MVPVETVRSFKSVRGEELKGSFVSGGDATPVVVLAHGYTSNRNSCKFAQIAAALAAAGISSLRFDHPMAIGGLSERHGPFRMGNHNDEVDDIHAAVTFLRDNGDTVVGVLGHSKGGSC